MIIRVQHAFLEVVNKARVILTILEIGRNRDLSGWKPCHSVRHDFVFGTTVVVRVLERDLKQADLDKRVRSSSDGLANGGCSTQWFLWCFAQPEIHIRLSR